MKENKKIDLKKMTLYEKVFLEQALMGYPEFMALYICKSKWKTLKEKKAAKVQKKESR